MIYSRLKALIEPFNSDIFKIYVWPAIMFFTGVGLAYQLAWLQFETNLDRLRDSVRLGAETLRADLTRELLGAVYLTEGMAGSISLEGGISENKFAGFAREMMRRTDTIRHVALLRGTTITNIYPLKGNEEAIGTDLSRNADQWPGIQEAIRSRRGVVAGPLTLVQGGQAVVCRVPVFLNESDGTYWGLISTVVDFDRLLSRTSLQAVESRLAISIRGKDGLGDVGEVFYGEALHFEKAQVLLDIILPTGSWQISASPIDGWPAFRGFTSLIFIGGFLFSFLLSYFFHRMMFADRERRREVAERRQAEAEMQLMKDIALGIAEAGDFGQALRHILVEICDITGWDVAEIWIPDNVGGYLQRHPAWFSRNPGYEEFRQAATGLKLARGEGLSGLAWETKKVQWVEDLRSAQQLYRSSLAIEAGLLAGIAVPVLSGDDVPLVLVFFLAEGYDRVEPRLEVVSAVAAQLGLIIARKKAEDEVRTLNLQLENRVFQRTEELIQSNRELESFTYTVSHDLRAPLRAINGFSALLKERSAEALDQEGRRYLKTIADATRRMGSMVDDLLLFARLNRKELHSESLPLDPLFRSIIEELLPMEENRKIDIDVSPLPVIEGDPGLLRLAFLNLISNSIKFTRRVSAARIEIRAEEDANAVTISISDNGTGFNMKYAGRLFGIFQRLHKEEDYEGTGVGLSLVNRIVQRHKGTISFDAEEGSGATFSVTLPFRIRETEAQEREDPAHS